MSNEVLDCDIAYPFLENDLSAQEKINRIEVHFRSILETLGMDLTDDSLQKTPYRYAKMLVSELCKGLDDSTFPQIVAQENKFNYKEPLITSNISIHSLCEHHFVPFMGYCHIAYVPRQRIIGLSKLNRVAQFFARRPQVQERLTRQITVSLMDILQTPDVAVVIDALHLCVRMRGVKDRDALTRTTDLNGAFLQDHLRQEFFYSIPKLSDLKL
jgi:GTP cyclohydrolase IA